jgi:fructose-1,6-bisphosphatase I
MKTLTDWLSEQATASDGVRRGDEKIATACIEIAALIERAPFEGQTGALDSSNVQGEVQKALDVLSNDVFLARCAEEPAFAGFASEELDDVTAGTAGGDLLVAFDPLDGSSNLDVSMCVGSIFSILPAPAGKATIEATDFFQPGRAQLAAGYALYGPQTMLVLSVGGEVCGFTLDRAHGAWLLTHPAMQVPADSGEYAINASNERHWRAGLKGFVADMKAGKDGPLQRDFNMRWLAAMVADVHRVLVRGGIFVYPADARPKLADGKLRVLYECAPMAYLVEKAGGLAYAATGPMLDTTPDKLHQRAPILLGSRNLVAKAWEASAADAG